MIDKYAKEHRKMHNKDTQFVCRHCGRTVSAEAPGTGHRNHCPRCLRSVHLDNKAGDRASSCGGIMEPIAISVRKGREWVIIHRCTGCGTLKENRIAGDDNEMALLSLAVRPVAQPPFPLDGLYEK
jgi:DNA-directed RNA polymerase subunit RPC12/RpoP